MNKSIELLDEVETHLMQGLDLIDIMIVVASENLDKARIVGPLEILKRDFEGIALRIDEYLSQINQDNN